MTTFWLIRHAETDMVGRALSGRMPGVHLNAAGRRQAEALARQAAEEPLGAIYSSPLERALETAEPLARARNLRIRICEAANEVEFGEWTGMSFAELAPIAEWRRFNALRSSTAIPGGEWMLEVESRIVGQMECLRRLHPDSLVALVSHADVIKAAIAHFAGIPLDLFDRLEISPASISVVCLDDYGPRILRVNQRV